MTCGRRLWASRAPVTMRRVSSGPSTRPPAPPAPAEIDRRLSWRLTPLLVFLGLMIGLGAAAAVSLLAPRRVVSGIPEDADMRAAMDIMLAEAPIGMGGLRFRSALTGEAGPGVSQPGPLPTERARALVARAGGRRPFDPRPAASIAHLDLAQRMFAHAERGYRRALMLAPHFGEARLGLGVSLALRAEREADPLERRSLRLQAVAQFAAVPAGDPVHAHALYDQATLLERVGRHAEAEDRALEYLRGDPASAWADSLASRLGLARPLEVRARSG